MSRRQAADILFTVVVLALVAVAVWDARDWEIKARLFPWVIGIPLLALLALQLGLELVRRRGVAAHEGGESILEMEGVEPAVLRRRAFSITGWLVGFAGIIWMLGFPVGGTLGTLAYLKITAREKWVLSLAIAAGTAAVFWILANPLTVPFPRGYLFELVGIPL